MTCAGPARAPERPDDRGGHRAEDGVDGLDDPELVVQLLHADERGAIDVAWNTAGGFASGARDHGPEPAITGTSAPYGDRREAGRRGRRRHHKRGGAHQHTDGVQSQTHQHNVCGKGEYTMPCDKLHQCRRPRPARPATASTALLIAL